MPPRPQCLRGRPIGASGRKVLAGFDHGAEDSLLRVEADSASTAVRTGRAYALDAYSPHDTTVLEVERSMPGREASVGVHLTGPVDARRDRHLTLRAAQLYDDASVPEGEAVEVRIRLCDRSRCAEAGTERLAFPIHQVLPVGQTHEEFENLTKNGMRTLRVRIRHLDDAIDLGRVVRVEVGFGPGQATRFHVDDLMLTR